MASFRSGVQIISHISKNQECQLRNLRSYSKDRFSVKCCRREESQVEKCPKPRPTKSWLSLFKKREPPTPEDGESKPPKRSTSWLTFWRQPEIDAAPLPPRYTCRLELERRRYKGELDALKEGRTPHAWEPDVMVITEDCHDPIVCHSMTEAYPHQPPRPHPNRLARCRSSERRQTRYKDARLQETKPEEEWRHIKDQGAFYMAVRTECPRKEDPPAGYNRRTCPEYKGIEMRNSRLSWCEAVKNIKMDPVAEFPKPKTYDPTPRESKGAVIPECTLRKDGTSSPLATQDRFQEPVHVRREVSTLQTRTCGEMRKVPIKEDREEVNDTRLQEIPYRREDANSEVIDHNAEQDQECRVEPTKTPDAMEVSEVVCDQAKNSPDRVEKCLISEGEKGDTMTTSGHCLSSYLKNKEGKPNVCKHKLCVEECAPRAFPTEGGCDSLDLKEKCVEDSRRVVPPTNDPESMITDPDTRVKCDLSKPSPDDSKKPRGRNFSTLSSSPAFSLDHHSTMPLIRNSCRSVVCKMMHTSAKTNTCVSSVFRKKDRRWCEKPLDSDPVQGKTKKLDQHVCEKQSAGSVNISNSGKCGKEGKPNLVCSKKKNGETKQRPGSEIAVNVLECKDRPSKKVKNLLSKNYATIRSTKFEDNNIKLKKLADCPTVEKTMPPPDCFPNHKQHKLPEERKSKECLEERKLKECLKVEIEVTPPSCKGKENTKICNLQKSTDICDSKNTSKRSMNSTSKIRKCKKGGKKAISHSSFSIYSLDNTFKTTLKFQGYCRYMSSDEQSHLPILKNQSFRNEEDSTLFYGSLPKKFTKGSFNGSRIPEPIEYLKTRQSERKVPDFNFDHTTFLRKTNYTSKPGKKFLHASTLGLKSKDSKKTGKKEGKKAPCKKKELKMKEPEPLDCPAVILPGCSQPEFIACSRERKIEHVSECHRIPTISYAECVKDLPPAPLPSECDCLSNAYKSSLSGYNSFNSNPLIYSGEATFNKASANMVVHERQVGLNKSQSLPKVITSFKSNLQYVRVRPLETKECQPMIRSTSKKQVKRKCEEVRLKTRPSKVQDEMGLPTKEKALCNQISDPELHIKPNEEEKVTQAFRSYEKQNTFENITESNKTQIIVPNVTQISNSTETTFLRRMKTWFSFLVPTLGVKGAGNNNLNDSVTIHHQSHASQEREENPEKNRDDDILKHTLSEVCVNNLNKDDHSSPVAKENKNSFILDETQVDIKPTETKFKVDTAKVGRFIPNINVQNGEKRIKSESNKVSVSQNTIESIKLHAFNASQRTIGVEAENTSAKPGDSMKKTKGNIERTITPPLKQETFNPLSDETGEQIVQGITATPTHRQKIFKQISDRQGHIYKKQVFKRVKSTGQTEHEVFNSKNDVIKHQNCVWKKPSEPKIDAMRYISESTECRAPDQKDPMKTKKENRCGVQVKQKRYSLQKVCSKNTFSNRLPNMTDGVGKVKPSKVKLSESPRRENVGKQEIACLKNSEMNATIHKTETKDPCTTKEHGYYTSAVGLGVVHTQRIVNKGERKRRDSPVALRDTGENLLQPTDHKINILKTGAIPEIDIPQLPGYKLNVLKTVATSEINIIQPSENALNIAATPEINIPQTPRHMSNALKTGADPEINIPQPPEKKLNDIKTGADPEINIPQPPELKLNALTTGAEPEINILQLPEKKLNDIKTGADPEINISQPPEHVLNAWKTGAKSSLPPFKFESKTNEKLKLDLPSHFYDKKIVNKQNMTPDKPSRFAVYDCDEIIESEETDECRMKDKLSEPNIILSVNEGDENVFELTNDTKKQIKMCSKEQIQSNIQIDKSKTMLDKVDTLVFQEEDDTTQIKGLPKHYFKPQTTNQFLDKATNDPKKIPEFLFPDSQYNKIINLNNVDPTNIDNKRKLSMIMLQYKQIFEAKSFNSKGDSFRHQSGGGSKSKYNGHENHPSCEKTHVNEMVYSGEKINYSELNTAELNEGHNYPSSKSKMSDSTYTDEKTSRYNSHLKYQEQKLKAEIEVCANTRARARDSEIYIDKNSNMEIKVCKEVKPCHDPCLAEINNKYKTPSKIPNKKDKICAPLNEIANLETSKTRKEVELPSKLNCVATSCNNNESRRIKKTNPLTSKRIYQTNSVKQKICGEKSQVNLKDNSLENTTKIIKKRKPKHYKIEENIKYSLEKGGHGKCSKCSKIEKKLCPSYLDGKVRKSSSRKKANKKRQSPDEALNNAAENLSVCKTLFQAADKLSIGSPHQSGSPDVVSKRTILLLYEEKVDGKSSKNKTNESPKFSKQFYKETNDILNKDEEPNKVSEKFTQYQKCRKTEASPAVSIQIKKETETCPIIKVSKRYTSKMRKRGLNLVPISTKKTQPSSASYSTYNAHYTPWQFQEHGKHVTSQNNMEKSSLDRLNNEKFKEDRKSLSDKLSEDETSNSKLHEDYSEINTKQDTDTLIEEIRKCNISSLTTIKEVTRTNLIDEINGLGKIYYSNKSGSYTQRYDIPTYSNNKLISHGLILRRYYSEYKAGDLNVPGGGSLNKFRKITEPCVQISKRMKSTDSKDDSACRFKDESNSKKGKINSASGTNNKSTKAKGIIENDPNVSSETSPCGNHLKYAEKSTTSKEGAFSDKGEVKKETSSSFFKIPSWCKSKPMKVETNTPQNGSPTTKTEIAKSPSDCGRTEPSPLCGICGYKNTNKISPGAIKSSSVNTSNAEEVCSKTKSEKLSSICDDNEASEKSEMSSKMLKSCRSTPVCGGKETAKKDETGGLKKDLSTSSLVCGKEESQKLDPNILRTEPKCPPPDKINAEKLCPRIQDSIPPPTCIDKSKSTCPKVSLNSSNCKDSKTKKCSQVEYSKAPSCANRSKSICPKLEISKCKEVKNNTELEKQTHTNIETFKHSPLNEITDKYHTQKSKPVDTTASPTNEDKCHPKSNDAPDCKYPESPRVTCMTTRQTRQFSESKGGSCESTISCPPRKDPSPKAPVCKTHHKSLEKIIKQTSLKDPSSKCDDEGTTSKGAKRLERPKYEPRAPDKDEKEDFSARKWMEKYGHKLKMKCPPMKPTVAEIPCEVVKKPQQFLQCKGEIVKEQPTMVNTGKEDSKKIVGEMTDMRDENSEHDLTCRKCQWGDTEPPELGPDGEVIRADEKWPFQKKEPETEN